jgi:transcriptional regulator with XRE-family HTH domain
MDSKIREYLLEKQAMNGWKQDDMAAALGVPKATLSRWLHGHFLPGYEAMKKIAKGLKVPLQEVLDAREGRYVPMREAERQAIEINNKYGTDAVLAAASEEVLKILSPHLTKQQQDILREGLKDPKNADLLLRELDK